MMQALIGFLSGIGVSLFTIMATTMWQRRTEKNNKIEKISFTVYMKLLNLYNQYFWVASGEIYRSRIDEYIEKKIRTEAWEIADLLRCENDINLLNDILKVLMSNDYDSASVRHDHMNKIIDELGMKVNPKYTKTIRTISETNVKNIANGKEDFLNSTTPAFIGQFCNLGKDSGGTKN